MGRNFFKTSTRRSGVSLTPLPAPTPGQHMGYRKAHLSQLMKKAGVLNVKASLAILKMKLEEVEKQIAIYQEADQIQAQKDELKELVFQAYSAGFLPKVEWVQAETWINGLEPSQVPNQIAYYTRLIQSKQAA